MLDLTQYAVRGHPSILEYRYWLRYLYIKAEYSTDAVLFKGYQQDAYYGIKEGKVRYSRGKNIYRFESRLKVHLDEFYILVNTYREIEDKL